MVTLNASLNSADDHAGRFLDKFSVCGKLPAGPYKNPSSMRQRHFTGDLKQNAEGPTNGAADLQQLTIQFDHNSVDVRGMRVDEVSGAVDEAIAAAPSGTAVFIVHGMGTGRLKAEIHSLLKRSSQV